MYTPAAFREDNIERQHELMRKFSFATLVSSEAGALTATHLPFVLDSDRGPYGTLRTHLARQNPQWKSWAEGADNGEAMIIFEGPHAYISPSYYITEPNVPTWNYAVVHAYGRPRILDDTGLRGVLESLVATFEAGKPAPWSMDKLSDDYIEKMMRAIVGIEIEITHIEGKIKMNQNRDPRDILGAVLSLEADGDPMAVETARLIRQANFVTG